MSDARKAPSHQDAPAQGQERADEQPNPGDPGPEMPEPRTPEDPYTDPRLPHTEGDPPRGV